MFQRYKPRLTVEDMPPNQTSYCSDCTPSKKKAHIHNIVTVFFVQLPDQLDAFFDPKNVSETNAIRVTPSSFGQLEKRKSSHATDVV